MKRLFTILLFLGAFCTYGKSLSNAELQHNTHDAYEKSDKKLNIIYKKLMNRLEKEDKKALRKAQRNWLKFRDTECYFEGYPYRGGTGEYTMTVSCLYELTEERINHLKNL